MNNNLMLRSMFFMNDDARHFLAPALPLPPCDSEYFQKKSVLNNALTLDSSESQTPDVSKDTSHNPSEKVTNIFPKQRPHVCDECGKTFLMKHHLTTHLRVHTGERPHVCPECGKSFALKHCLSTHLLLHTSERPYKCQVCNKTFTLKHHLVSHERVHSRDRPFECPECGRRFPQKRHLTTHIKFHSGERPFSCEVCDESFSREEHLVMHSRFHGGQRPFICPDCGAGFLRKFELVNHERQHGRNPESCPMCGKEFLQKRTLLVHVRTCGLSLPTIPTHNISHTKNGNNENSSSTPNKTCKECGETFASVEGLGLHLRLHFGDHSFLSDICSLAASLKQSAVNAALSLSLANKKTHICPDCGRGFTQKHGLFTHKQRHENGSCKLKPYICEKCGKSFAQKNHLSLHERQHMDLSNQRNTSNKLTKNKTNRPLKDKKNMSESDSNESSDELDDRGTNSQTIQTRAIRQNVNCSQKNQSHSHPHKTLHRNEDEIHHPYEPIIEMNLPNQPNTVLERVSDNQPINIRTNSLEQNVLPQTQSHCHPHKSENEEEIGNHPFEPIIQMDLPNHSNISLVPESKINVHHKDEPIPFQPLEPYLDQSHTEHCHRTDETLQPCDRDIGTEEKSVKHKQTADSSSIFNSNLSNEYIKEDHRPPQFKLENDPLTNNKKLEDKLNDHQTILFSQNQSTSKESMAFQYMSNRKHEF